MTFYFYDEDSATYALELFADMTYAPCLIGHTDGTWELQVPGLI